MTTSNADPSCFLRVMLEIVAHRGASAHAPENTFAAYDLALEHGAQMIEVDLRTTADNRLVALHDPTLERTAGLDARIDALGLAELKAIPRAVRPPRLSKLLERYGHRTTLLLELKDPDKAMVKRVVRTVDAAGLRDRVIVQSFDLDALRRMQRTAPDIETAALCDPLPRRRGQWLRQVARLGVSVVGLRARDIDHDVMERAGRNDLKVRAWTVNDLFEAAWLYSLGVDALITDDPALIRDGLGEPAALAA